MVFKAHRNGCVWKTPFRKSGHSKFKYMNIDYVTAGGILHFIVFVFQDCIFYYVDYHIIIYRHPSSQGSKLAF